jgi:hypothetical protein
MIVRWASMYVENLFPDSQIWLSRTSAQSLVSSPVGEHVVVMVYTK